MTTRVMWLGMALLISTAACGVDYQWCGTGGSWNNGANWTGGTGTDYPDDAGDSACIANGFEVDAGMLTGSSITAGEIIVRDISRITHRRSMTFIIDDNGTKSGNWWWAAATEYGPPGSDVTVDLDGNFYHMSPNSFTSGVYRGIIRMRGNDKAVKHTAQSQSSNVCYEIYGKRVWDNGSAATGNFTKNYISVMSGASIVGKAGVTGTWKARDFRFADGQANLPALRSDVNFGYCYMPAAVGATVDNVPGQLVVTGGITYPQDVTFEGGWMNSADKWTYEWKFKPYAAGRSADVVVGRDLKFSGGAMTKIWLNTLENGTSHSANLTVNRDLIFADSFSGSGTNPQGSQLQGLRLNNSQVKIGGNFVAGSADGGWDGWFAGNSGTIDLGNATVRVGGNFTVNRMTRNARLLWNRNNTSTLIFDGNGTTATQTLRIYGDDGMAAGEHTPLHNLIVNTKGTVRLDDYRWGGMASGPAQSYWVNQDNAFRYTALVLTGDLDIECGTWVQNNRKVIFNGPEHHWTNLTSSKFDNIELLPDSIVVLESSIIMDCQTTDHLVMGHGSRIYLNEFNFFAEGQWYIDTPYKVWTFGEGEIISGPEPATLFLFGTGALILVGRLRRRRMK